MCSFLAGETRTVESYKQDVNDITPSGHSRGVKADSVFNRLLYFHVSDPGLPP